MFNISLVNNMYPLAAAVIALVLAQVVKPFLYYVRYKEWNWHTIYASGGFPSSHSALVSALALAVGFQEKFSSTIFAVTCAMAIVVIYDAANVRFYAGQNIKLTQQLVKDVQKISNDKLDDPIYQQKYKDVLGHKWFEVFGGIILGVIVAIVLK